MKRSFALILMVICVFICVSRGLAWTEDVEGVLMPSPKGGDNMSDTENIMKNIEPTEDSSSEDMVPTIEWE
jgi:hypothetical protein